MAVLENSLNLVLMIALVYALLEKGDSPVSPFNNMTKNSHRNSLLDRTPGHKFFNLIKKMQERQVHLFLLNKETTFR